MTEILNKEFSRTTFLKGGGALVVGFSMLGAAAATSARSATDPFESNGPFDQTQIDSWLTIHADNTATLKPGKIELGQGTLTGLLMIAAEELDLSMAQMKFAPHDTNTTANQGSTVGSQGIQSGGRQVRAAAAAARGKLLDLAATELRVAKSSLSVSNGVVSGGGRSVTYGALLGGKLFNTRIPGGTQSGANPQLQGGVLSSGAPGTKPISQYKLVGKHGSPRVDIPAKVNGQFTYVHNVKVPGMLHGRVVRPRGQGAYGKGTAPDILAVDASSIKNVPGARIIRFQNFLGVVAPTEYSAIQAAAQLKVTWAEPPALPTSGNLWKSWRELDSKGQTPARVTTNTGNVNAAYAAAPIKVSQSYKFHYTGHLPIGPSCCVAHVTPQGARIFSNTQDAYGTRGQVFTALQALGAPHALPQNRIRVSYYEGGSTYGSSPYQDAAQAAAVLSALAGAPVRLQFMRWDEHGWDNYGPAQMTDVRAAVDASGKLTAFEWTQFGQVHYSTQSTQQQITGTAQFGSQGRLESTINGTQYSIANRKVIGKTVPLEDNSFKVSFLRAPDALQSAFASEQIVDELAYLAKKDPVEFRRMNLATTATDPQQRWRNVLEGAARAANWQPRVAASNLSSANVVTGRGFSFGYYSNTMAAGVADIEVNKKTGAIVVKNAWVATDAGFVVYPDGQKNNEEGAAMQGISRSLHEQLSFNRKGVTSLDWASYPMLRFKDAPKMTIVSLSRTDVPQSNNTTVAAQGSRSTGAGEPGLPPMGAAIANAFFDATGVRIREAPMTPARVRAVLKAAGR
jgi:CO/xanthine dehydrogenase Mo-binding subunit